MGGIKDRAYWTLYNETDENIRGSGSETILDEDEEMTEEEVQDDDGNGTDASSIHSADNSDASSEEIPFSHLSSDIQSFMQQFPEVPEQFQILSKIGEGIMPGVHMLILRHIQLRLQSRRQKVSPL
jgi:hypothetical protein